MLLHHIGLGVVDDDVARLHQRVLERGGDGKADRLASGRHARILAGRLARDRADELHVARGDDALDEGAPGPAGRAGDDDADRHVNPPRRS